MSGTIIDACLSPALFARWFRDPATWAAWFTFLRVLFGLSMDDTDRAVFTQCTARNEIPATGFKEAWLVVGRRGGKSLILSVIAVWLAVFCDWSKYLVPGERGTVIVVASDRKQARVIFRYVTALLTRTPALAALVERETAEGIDLANGITIEIMTANFRSIRGYTLVAGLLDEIAFWRGDDSASPDEEVIAAIKPAMSSIPGAMLLCASSPYAKRGVLWKAHRRHFGTDSPVLLWQASTETMNPTIPEDVIAAAYEADPSAAAAEYGAEFRSDLEDFVSREVVDAVTIRNRFELPPVSGINYKAFVDPSGGSSDSFTLAIAHRDSDGRGILDAIRERRPPFSPDDVVAEFSALLSDYGIARVSGDRYAGEWPRERFRERAISYEPSELAKSQIYQELLPLLNAGRVELLDHQRMAAQLVGLERRTARGGKDSVDHSVGAHDDLINSAAGALVAVAGKASGLEVWKKIAENAGYF